MKTVTIPTLQRHKQAGEKFAVVAAYDATFARTLCAAGIEAILVGDSLGNVLQGQDSTVPVTTAEMAYHTRCVKRGNQGALIIADLPFMSYATVEQTLSNATTLMQAGAHMVKLEGGAWLAESVRQLVERGIPVCAHLGLTPQSVNTLGGYRVQGKDDAAAQQILDDALTLQQAGASLLVVECVPTALGTQLSEQLEIPVIGIGAGPNTDAQVLVLHDLLGLNDHPPRFVQNFMLDADSIQQALANYQQAVVNGTFPAPEHCFE